MIDPNMVLTEIPLFVMLESFLFWRYSSVGSYSTLSESASCGAEVHLWDGRDDRYVDLGVSRVPERVEAAGPGRDVAQVGEQHDAREHGRRHHHNRHEEQRVQLPTRHAVRARTHERERRVRLHQQERADRGHVLARAHRLETHERHLHSA